MKSKKDEDPFLWQEETEDVGKRRALSSTASDAAVFLRILSISFSAFGGLVLALGVLEANSSSGHPVPYWVVSGAALGLALHVFISWKAISLLERIALSLEHKKYAPSGTAPAQSSDE